ncbi:MAG: hypothetical protein AAF890_05590 [Pseudomonadota bacterium]
MTAVDCETKMKEARALLAPFGLTVFGAFDHGEGFGILVGGIGSSFWPSFSNSPEYRDRQADPLDRWTLATLGPLAETLGARPAYPFGQPFQPFQRWAREATGMEHSPLGLLIHPQYGLWCSFRGAFVFAEGRAGGSKPVDWHPCDRCVDKPCLSACPVDAFSTDGFDYQGCRTYLTMPESDQCRTGGCRARLACPVGEGFAYDDAQQAFHMQAFGRY